MLLSEYGYLSYIILFLYCAIKSGSMPLFAGMAAQYEYLNLSLVVLVVFFGGYLGDELRFYLVRKYGDSFITSRPRLAKLAAKAKRILDRYGLIYIFIYRYPKGMRTIGALPVALTNIKWRRFTLLNASSSLLWAAILIAVGYVFGPALESIISKQWGFFSVGLLLIFLAFSYWGWRVVTCPVSSKKI
jgi:membrane protein DedA with SNARE-associated domain